MKLRRATLDDAELLLSWRNDPESRKQSTQKEEISPENHLAWLIKSLSMTDRKLYIAEHNDLPVGTVRSDIHEDGTVELSWSVAPSQRGKGVGKAMVAQFVKEIHPTGKLIAVIRKGNSASEKIAQALGLHQKGAKFPEEDSAEDPLMIWL